MYIKNEKPGQPFTAASCTTSFDNDCRMVILDIYDDLGIAHQVRVPEGLMATMTGHFLRERLFGLH